MGCPGGVAESRSGRPERCRQSRAGRPCLDGRTGAATSGCCPGSRLADAESLAAKPGFRERLNPTREFLLASRQREDQRVAEERRRHEADLQAARDREEAAKALAAAESQAKEEAQRHASVLRRRNWILRASAGIDGRRRRGRRVPVRSGVEGRGRGCCAQQECGGDWR